MHEEHVDIIGAELTPETIEIGAGGGGVARPSLREDGDLVAGDVLKGFGDVRVAAIRIGGVEETQAVVVAVEEQVGETFDAEGGCMGMVADANGAGAHEEAA